MSNRKKDPSKAVLGSPNVQGQGTGYEMEMGTETGATDSARKRKGAARK